MMSSLFGFVSPVIAQGTDLCSVFGPLCNTFTDGGDTPGDASRFVVNRIQIIIGLVFIVIIIVAVFIIVKSGVKYIQSQGEEGQIAEATKAIQSVFIGIAMLFLGVIGIVLLLAFFNADQFISQEQGVDQILNPDLL